MRSRMLLLVGLAVVAVGACGGDSSDKFEVEGIEWRLQSIDGAAVSAAEPTLLLTDGQAAGTAGCNSFSGSYELDGDALTLGQLATTRMACAPDVADVESAYLAALDRVAGFNGDASELNLTDASGNTLLTYAAP